jgi:rubrerythrin
MHLATYLGLLDTGERTLADSYRQVAAGHADEADVHHICLQLAAQCEQHVDMLAPLVERYGERQETEPERLRARGLKETRTGGLGLLRDLHDLYMLVNYLDIAWTLVGQAGQGARDQEVIDVVAVCEGQTATQVKFLKTRLKQAAPQALLVTE